jgi:hypothetical protein
MANLIAMSISTAIERRKNFWIGLRSSWKTFPF